MAILDLLATTQRSRDQALKPSKYGPKTTDWTVSHVFSRFGLIKPAGPDQLSDQAPLPMFPRVLDWSRLRIKKSRRFFRWFLMFWTFRDFWAGLIIWSRRLFSCFLALWTDQGSRVGVPFPQFLAFWTDQSFWGKPVTWGSTFCSFLRFGQIKAPGPDQSSDQGASSCGFSRFGLIKASDQVIKAPLHAVSRVSCKSRLLSRTNSLIKTPLLFFSQCGLMKAPGSDRSRAQGAFSRSFSRFETDQSFRRKPITWGRHLFLRFLAFWTNQGFRVGPINWRRHLFLRLLAF